MKESTNAVPNFLPKKTLCKSYLLNKQGTLSLLSLLIFDDLVKKLGSNCIYRRWG